MGRNNRILFFKLKETVQECLWCVIYIFSGHMISLDIVKLQWMDERLN
jgi:hypothetical protein